MYGVLISKERLFQFGTAQPFFPSSPARNFDFGSYSELFMCRTKCINHYKVFASSLTEMSIIFSRLEFNSECESVEPV